MNEACEAAHAAARKRADGPALARDVVLQCHDLHKRFQEGSGKDALDVQVLRGVDLQVHAGADAGHRRRLGFGQEHAAASAGRAGRAQQRAGSS